MSSVINDQDIEFDNINSTNLDIVTVRKHCTSGNELSKNYLDDSIGEN